MSGTQHARRRYHRRAILKGAVATGAGAVLTGFPAILHAQRRPIAFDRPLIAALIGKEGDPTDMAIRLIPKITRRSRSACCAPGGRRRCRCPGSMSMRR